MLRIRLAARANMIHCGLEWLPRLSWNCKISASFCHTGGTTLCPVEQVAQRPVGTVILTKIAILASRVADNLLTFSSMGLECRQCKRILPTVSVPFCSVGREITSEMKTAGRATTFSDKSPSLVCYLTDSFATTTSAIRP